jgi:chromosome segregation protein
MRIRRLELVGFKSFVTRTRFDFPDGITAIVGPNGCGKSNIVDAIRWVLGEQSPAHLRGKAMEDVIFNGNERAGPLGMAEVSLVLERAGGGPLWGSADEGTNEESDLQRQIAGASEIMVTRRYFRSGESEFFINRAPCRLRDITELFLGSGVGTKAYSTIEQGRVEQLVNAKPDTLRLFIEEAAGTTRYRSRKVMAERKLERTRENLNRLADVIREIERQANTLSRQAKRAEEYRRCRDELRALEVRTARAQYGSGARDVAEAEGQLRALSERERQLADGLAGAEEALSGARGSARSIEERHQRLNVHLVECRLEADAAAQRMAYLDDALRGIEGRSAEARTECGAIGTAADEAERDRAEAETECRGLEASVQQAGTRHESLEAELRERLAAAAAGDAGLDAAKTAVMDVLSEQMHLQNLAAVARRDRDDADRRIDGARQRVDALEAAHAESHRALEDARDGSRRIQGEATSAADAVRDQTRAFDDARTVEATAAREAEVARERAADVRSRLASLAELSRRWEGYGSGVEQAVAHASPDVILGAVADVLRVPRAYEAAVAAALGPRLQSLITPTHGDALRVLEALGGNGGGRASFIPLTTRASTGVAAAGGRCVLDVVEVADEFRPVAESLLGNVLLVDSLADALAHWEGNGTPVVLVTMDGSVVDAVGAVTGGSDPPLEEAFLARNRELRELRTVVAEAVAKAEETARRHAGAAQRVEELRLLHGETSRRLETLRVEQARVAKDEERLDQECRRLTLELEAQRGMIAELERGRGEAEERIRRAEGGCQDVRLRLQQAEAALAEWRREIETANAQADAARQRLTATAIEEAERRAAYARASEAMRRARERLEALSRRRVELEGRLQELKGEHDRLHGDRHAAETDRQRKLEELGVVERGIQRTTEEVAAAGAEIVRLEQAVAERRHELEACREERPGLEVRLAERRAEIDHLARSIKEKYGEDIAREWDANELLDAAGDAEVTDRIEVLRSRLLQIGDVHVGAVEELDELRNRHDFLTRQRDDLQRSIDDLRRTIAKLNRLSRTRFRETFEEANRSLQQVFPRLFPGGRAQLVLTEVEEDGGEPGVEIVVQPAGKKLQSLSLLSGGEKALTAVALILSLFMIRPTPFCVLDEVDAPLDDVNVGRFDHLIREISRISQFVVITHNKRTMEAADTLYGITMEEAGVSRVVSVRLKQAA